jgi:two-component system sensor histidine kinase FlrB
MRSRLQTHRKAGSTKVGSGKLTMERGLAQAFLSFTQAAGSLEKSYTLLQNEVERLRKELRKANAELDWSLQENARVRAFLAQVLENLPCGVVVVSGADQKVQVLNPQARRLLQIPPEWNEASAGTRPELLAKLMAADAGEKENREQEWVEEGSSGSGPIGISCANLNGRRGSGSDRIWIIRDITEQKRIAAERERAQQSLALAEITTLLAHEIRNPLGSMELFTGLLEEAVANNPETRQWVNHLRAGLRSLSATVNNVLQFHAQGGAQLVPLELDRLLREVTEFLLPVARQRGQQIKFENTIGCVMIQADANRLKQVFLNLALNAFRAMPPGGTLHFHMGWAPQYPGGLVRVDVQDEGRGIAPELLERIFEAGFTSTPGSPGLGLAVCKRIVEQHAGAMEVQSKPKEGARFTIVLPVAGEKA